MAGEKKVRMICGTCGSPLVSRDAWADWDEVAQDWTLGAIYDFAFCHTCETETRIVEASLE
ncbi:hypothetical protein [Tsuneonella mangrovi]|uniref:hypothetical protein n=1 Tax=Tsuneonella mangrovi TaxID=1982042 RepID=UPI000BA2034B|nr:hypothetical protein [Tsuneonella mangrovi]